MTEGSRDVNALLSAAAVRLEAAGVERPLAEARYLLTAAGGPDRLAQLTGVGGPLPPEVAATFADFLRQRAERRPLAQIVGRREFWGRPFIVTPAVLIPRPETETLVARALGILAATDAGSQGPMLLDLGVGSGCILLTLMAECGRARGLGVDRSRAALEVAAANAAALAIEPDRLLLVQGDWTACAAAGRFDLVVTNPPYIATAAIGELEPEVAAHEPWLALDGGIDGLGAYRILLPDLNRVLAAGGRALLEVGAGQAAPVALLARAHGLEASAHRDLAGVARVVELTPRCRANPRPDIAADIIAAGQNR